MSKHTPGPWSVTTLKATNGDTCVGVKSDEVSVVVAWCHGRSIEEEHANARLMAESTKLLAVLKESVSLYESNGTLVQSILCGKWVNDARAAIAKATGGAA